jgi:hypothetical protein
VDPRAGSVAKVAYLEGPEEKFAAEYSPIRDYLTELEKAEQIFHMSEKEKQNFTIRSGHRLITTNILR